MKKILFLVILFFTIGTISLLIYKEGLLPVNKNDKKQIVFVVNQGDSLTNIINKLNKNNLIRNRLSFYSYIRLNKLDRKLQAGVFHLNKSMDIKTIVNTLLTGSVDVSITIVEGIRKEEIADIIQKYIDFNREDFIINSEEGYLFPDTYFLPKEASASSIIDILEKNFTNKYIKYVQNIAQSKQKNMKDIVILASLVEREANNEKDRKSIANILTKRLQNDWPLQVDATVQYSLGYNTNTQLWWKKNLSFEDLKINSLFNTYLYKGLPPTPICNPGLSSLIASAEANGDTPYWFYITGKDGITRYSKTIEEHQSLINKYLR